MQHQTTMMTLEAMAERGCIISNPNAQIADMRMASWQKVQAAIGRAHRAIVDPILEVRDKRTRERRTIPIEHPHDRVFEDPLGNRILTNDKSYDPTGDTRLRTRDWCPSQWAQ